MAVALGDRVDGGLGSAVGFWLDLMISEGVSSLDGSVIVGISGCCCHPCFGFHAIWEEQEHVQMCFTFLFQRNGALLSGELCPKN